MPLVDNIHWLTALGFGALIVAVCFWSRFDEPSYSGTTDHFTRYKPRFSTSRRRYTRAKFGYVSAVLILFFVFCAVPEIFYALIPSQAPRPSDTTLPLAVALLLIALQTFPRLNEGERRIRGLLHSVARIPESICTTVAQLRGSPFNCSHAATAAQTRKLGIQIGKGVQPERLNKLIFENDLVQLWYSVGCVLDTLSENNQANTGIDPLFYDNYRDELDSMGDRHIALAPPVRKHLNELLRADCPSEVSRDPALLREIRTLRDRLYTFVACGVRYSVRNDAESLEMIGRLGFPVKPMAPEERQIQALVWFSGAALLILSVLAVWMTQLFIEYGLNNDQGLIDAFRVPTDRFAQFMWSWSTAAFYFFAVFGALLNRSVHIGRRDWFDINNLDRERPVLRYAKPILLGAALGYFVLIVIALLGGPAFTVSVNEIGKALVEVTKQTLPWAPLAIVIAAIALWLSDSPLQNEKASTGQLIVRAVAGALVMAIVGYLTSSLALPTIHQMGMASVKMGLFISLQIGLVTLVLCIIVQMSERHHKGRSFAGKQIEALTREGRLFCMALDRDNTARLFASNGAGATNSAVACWGHWQHFPEGTAVKWDSDGDRRGAGGFGLMSAFGDSLIYEGYKERFSGTPEFVFQLNIRNGSVAQPQPSPLNRPENDNHDGATAEPRHRRQDPLIAGM